MEYGAFRTLLCLVGLARSLSFQATMLKKQKKSRKWKSQTGERPGGGCTAGPAGFEPDPASSTFDSPPTSMPYVGDPKTLRGSSPGPGPAPAPVLAAAAAHDHAHDSEGHEDDFV